MAKRILAIPTAAPAMPVNPNTPATNAMIKKISVQPNISIHFHFVPLPISFNPAKPGLCKFNELFGGGHFPAGAF
jgi:hypothetical protein